MATYRAAAAGKKSGTCGCLNPQAVVITVDRIDGEQLPGLGLGCSAATLWGDLKTMRARSPGSWLDNADGQCVFPTLPLLPGRRDKRLRRRQAAALTASRSREAVAP